MVARRTFFGGSGGAGGAAGPATVEVYADAAARDTAIPAPDDGVLAFVGDELQVYAGGGWTAVTPGDQAALDLKAPLASPTFTGTPAAPTAAPGTSSTQVATTAYVSAANAAQTAGWRVRGEWSALVTDYAVGDVVYYRGATYVSKVAGGGPAETLAPSDATERTFETTAGSWAQSGGFSGRTRDTAVFHSGVASLRVTKTASDATGISNAAFPVVLAVGVSYTFKCWVRHNASQAAGFRLYHNLGDIGPTNSIPANTWTEYSWTFTSTATGSATLIAQNPDENIVNGNSFWVDDFSFMSADSVFLPSSWDLIAPAAAEIPSSFMLMGA